MGGGEVKFICPIVSELRAIDLIEEGMIKKIRGIAYSTRCSPQFASRVGGAVRGVVNQFIPDVYIYTDHYQGANSGLSPGYGLSVVAESTTGMLVTAELCAQVDKPMLPEDLGTAVGKMLCEEIGRRGCVDSSHQWLVLGLMCLTPEDMSRVRLGPLTQHSIHTLRYLSLGKR